MQPQSAHSNFIGRSPPSCRIRLDLRLRTSIFSPGEQGPPAARRGDDRARPGALRFAARFRALPPERELYRRDPAAVRGGFAANRVGCRANRRRAGIAADAALRRMEEVDLVHRRPDGTIWCAYPFSAQPTGHTVELSGGQRPLHAMCAVDALGIPLMLGRDAVVRCADPLNGRELVIRIDQAGEPSSDRADPVALIARTLREGPPPPPAARSSTSSGRGSSPSSSSAAVRTSAVRCSPSRTP